MIKLKVLTPKGELIKNEEVYSITVPTQSGVISVYDDHQPLISLLLSGEMEIHFKDGVKEYLFISSGLIRVDRESVVTVMADTSQLASDIDIDVAMEAKKKAEEYLKNTDKLSDADYTRLQADIEKEVLKIDIAKLRANAKDGIKVKVTKKL